MKAKANTMPCTVTNRAMNNLQYPSFTIHRSSFSLHTRFLGDSAPISPDINSLVSGGHLDLSLAPDHILALSDIVTVQHRKLGYREPQCPFNGNNVDLSLNSGNEVD
ncbi:MAG: hypothetical protein FRX48_04643 [Lasallia pustulata]|uniref:Uncharacterized protein n=1 Tax=Lasallia pustulata TaxID=136370 RepID=A0A5M8PRP2_9LECA|nr:MAG: hypothetical protein FRX48_04643 [Lasallia pustulata]